MSRLTRRSLKPVCPRCRAAEREALPLVLAHIERETEEEVEEGILHCPNPVCVQEYPIIDGVPIIVPDVASFIASQIVQITVGDGFGAALLSGEQNADEMRMKDGKVTFASNHAGGVQGGIATGQDGRMAVALFQTALQSAAAGGGPTVVPRLP